MSLKYITAFFVALALTVVSLQGGSWYDKSDKKDKMTTKENIVTIASSKGDFSTLVTGLKEADLVSVLQGAGPFTVFAPNNEAFSKLGTQLDELLKPENKEKLREILLLHVVPGKVTSQDITSMGQDFDAMTAAGKDVQIRVVDGKVMVDDAQVIKPDIEASNGVIHVIDTVITQ